MFEEDERGSDDELKLQFEAIRQFDEEDRKTALCHSPGLILTEKGAGTEWHLLKHNHRS